MQAGTERRGPDAHRVPLDLWVRLAHEDYEEPFDADAVDVSAGGLALKSDFLPEVGDRLKCRFDCPPEGGEIVIDGEVVWAHDAGQRSGEFGLRFGDLDIDAEDSLRRLVEHLGGERSHGALARLHLDGVATPIEAEIVEADGEWMTVEQELPFLRIGMGVAVEGPNGPPRGRLASVELRIENGTPRLVLGVAQEPASFDGEDEDDAHEEDEPAIVQAAAPDTLDEPEPVATEATLQDFDLPEALRDDDEEPGLHGAHAREAESARVFDIPTQDPEAFEASDDELGTNDKLAVARAKASQAWQLTRAKSAELFQKTKPALLAFWVKVVALFHTLMEKGGPKTKAAAEKAKALFGGLFSSVASRVSKKAKRRTTAAPPKRTAASPRLRRQKAEEEAAVAPPKRANRRILLLSAIAFAGVAAVVYFFSGGEEAEVEVETPPAAAAPSVAPEPEPAPAPAAPAIDPEAGEVLEAAPAAPAEPVEPTPEGGQLGAPTYPTLRDTAEAPSGPVTEGSSFGAAEVSGGRTATIRMSQTVTSVRGQQQSDGFTITVPGALALDRAGPIAAANPSVERAMILNRGDHSVLTVRFVAGRTPPYRVVARGRAIEVTIGR